MAQITEDYVSYETAKLLKEKGFEYDPDESYWLIDANNKMYWVSRIGAYDYVDVPTESFQRPKNGYRLVTQAMAMKWLREVHNIALNVCYLLGIWSYSVYRTDVSSSGYNSEDFDTYEEAAEAGIRFCLENVI